MKSKIIIGFFLILVTGPVTWSQVVSGIVNRYLKVDSVLTDRVKVENTIELAYFQPGDKVLLIQMTGATLSGTPTSQGFFGLAKNCGKFEILQVDEVTGTTEKYISFTDDLDNSYDHGEKIQLIRILEGDKITINGTVTAKDWDGSSGGIAVIIGLDTIILQGSTDVTGKGFRGGLPDENNYPLGDCHTGDAIINLPATTLGYAGYKGEGIITTSYTYAKGAAHALNGGGGGQGLFAGGGGGSNYRNAGDGGQQSHSCGDNINVVASGGDNLSAVNKFYQISTRQIIMGGGGGSGTENKALSLSATAGGDGGGIIMLITETFIGNGGVIRANGQDVTGTSNASGGGGGGGGTILIDAARYSGTFSVEILGGRGGNTLDNCTGAGGGGSGGVLWHSGSSFPTVSVTIDSSAGDRGDAAASCPLQYGQSVGDGTKKSSLILPLNGFLFNTIRGKDTLCAGQTPNLLTGSNPKGGNGIYTFAWQRSTDSITWDSIANTRDYQPGLLNQTTFYRRIVRSEGIIDVSRPIKVLVYNAIGGNSIAANDTLCNGATAKQLTGAIPAGGNGTYNYQWQYSIDSINWNTLGGATSPVYNPGVLTATQYYRRIVESAAVCTHISKKVTLTVLPKITSNLFFSPDTLICQALSPGSLNASTPLNGDGIYRYKWMQKPASGSWTEIGSSNVKQYNPGDLIETTLYQRIVYSGNDNACADTSAVKTVNVLPSITNNLINIDSSRWCAGDTPNPIMGLIPSGGAAGAYLYQWQIRTTGNWSTIDGSAGRDHTPLRVEETTYFRRLVASGVLKVAGQYACHDTSGDLKLTVIPYINNNLGLTDQTLCQGNTPLPFNPSSSVSGGNNVFTYQWLEKEEPSASWNNASGSSIAASYIPGMLVKTTYFARKVTSDICDTISDIVTVTVYPVINSNQITGSQIQYTCFNTGKQLNGPGYSGGKTGDYAFLWQQSTNGSAWSAADETSNTQADFLSSALTDSILFRRIIYSSATVRECADTSIPVLIRINPLPTGDVITSVDTLCGLESSFVSFSISGGRGPYEVTVRANDMDGQSKSGITALQDSIRVTFGNIEKSYDVGMMSIRDDNSCYADATGFSNKAVVAVYAVPEADAYPGDEVCSNQYPLRAAPPLPSHTGEWSLEGGTFADPSSPSTLVTIDNEHYGEQYIAWTVTNWHCPDRDSTLVIFDQQPTEIDAGESQVLDFLYSTQLAAEPPEVGTGTWKVVEGSGIISDENAYNATITELADNNLIRWTIINGVCPEIKDSMRITVNELELPKGFSPNGDGINEEFVIPTQNAEKIVIKIYNRTGTLVWESSDYTQGDLWRGKSKNNNDLPSGTYFYWMEIQVKGKTVPKTYKLFVEILR